MSKEAWESPELVSPSYQTARTDFRPADVRSQKKGRNAFGNHCPGHPGKEGGVERESGGLGYLSPKNPDIQSELRDNPNLFLVFTPALRD